MPPEIPGFYYDETKNRYFKIQANHVAPSGSDYSRQAVNAKKAIRKSRRREEAAQGSKRASTVTRSRLRQHPMLSFEARLGDRQQPPSTLVAKYFAAGLKWRFAVSNLADLCGHPGRPPPPPWGGGHYHCSASGTFAVEKGSGTMFADFLCENGNLARITMRALFRGDHPPDEDSVGVLDHLGHTPGRSDGYLYDPSRSETIADSPDCKHILAIGSGVVVWVEERPWQVAQANLKIGTCSQGIFPERADSYSSFLWNDSVHDLASQPGGHMVAVAVSKSLSLVNATDTTYPPHRVDAGIGEILKVSFKDRNVLMCSTRTGALALCDIRSPIHADSNVAVRLQHSPGITAMRRLSDGNRLLVNGMERMSIYDLRFTPPPEKTHSSGKAKAPSHSLSTPVLNFSVPAWRRPNRYDLGFAYDPELDIVLSASTDNHKNHRVGLWSAKTGQMIRSPLNKRLFDAPVTCADIVRVRDGPKSILLAGGRDITEWTIQGCGLESEQE